MTLMFRPSAPLHRTLLAALALTFATPALAQEGPQGARSTQVGVIELSQSDVPYTVTLPGRAVAFEQVDIRPRVAGVISEILYQAGRPVRAGTPLFTIDGDTYAADLKSAQATVDGAKAALEAAKATYARYKKLETTSISTEDVEAARVAVAQAEATLSSAEADRDMAQLNFDRTQITSPISGVPDMATVSVGAIVTANQADALTTVTRLDPIYVDVKESSRQMLEHRAMWEAGTLTRADQVDISLTLETGETYDRKGSFVSPSTTVSSTTGTTEMRLQFDNPERKILPGQFLRVETTLGTTRAVLVPQRATTRGSDGTLSAFVAVAGKAEKRTLTENGSYQNAWVVTDGVKAGDQLILDGLTNLQDGSAITTVPVTIDAQGVVQDAPATDTSAAGN
ncbi:membrane fusion protein (multidrug efflux system) [Rhodobacter aestuarii]|uniref:Membrane fusion protein, multidrug efflux system n=1 Tax=Rhodobacter aestuarii TaxID=453582 RepID=A0A1N7M0M0_9RHOB|nr:efflux RND transporter periplasmic adaptor subunit [Rhodobacter aestuarii]PTV94759.1 membrane fusion protein (multidrug efflux system) [Rhodobacter aestuarii]SIS79569.1 membrane fusion protein, multidrug efflux system [Rhodobacter aestuarii]